MSKQVERLPYPLSRREAKRAETFAPQGREVDFAIGGIPFRLAASSEIPFRVQTEDISKQQVDTQREPGEQSLGSWWRRSQDSFHEGAGALYQENRKDQSIETFRYWDSRGVDVFTPGKLRLLRKLWMTDNFTARRVRPMSVGGTVVNLVTNPRPAFDVDGWSPNAGAASSPPTVIKDPDNAWAKITWPEDDSGGGTDPCVFFPTATMTDGVEYTFACKVWNGNTGTDLTLQAAGGQSATYSGNGEWHTMTYTFTCTNPTGDKVRIIGSTPNAGNVTWVTQCILNEGAEALPYFDGDYYSSHWSGTPHASTSVSSAGLSSTQYFTFVDGDTLKSSWAGAGSPENATTLHDAGTYMADGFASGLSYFYVTNGGTLGVGTLSQGGQPVGTPDTWPLSSGTASRLDRMKYRLWVIGGRYIFQPDTTDDPGTAQQPIFTHPNTSWRYTSMAEGPAAVYFAGNDGVRSTIQAITIDESGGTPTLSSPVTVATFPEGELVQEIATLGGQYMGIGTNQGFRMAIIDNGNLTYGPLFLSPEDVQACTALTTQNRFFVVAFSKGGTPSSSALAYRVDTSVQTGEGEFAWAPDIESDTGPWYFNSLANVGNALIATDFVDGNLYVQYRNDVFVDHGWLQTGRIRFSTNEPKNFQTIAIDTAPLLGSIGVTAIDSGEVEHPIFTYGPEGKVTDTTTLGVELHHQKQMALKFDLFRGEGTTEGPELHSYLIRALPAVEPSFIYQVPLQCYDREMAASGHEYGKDGFALERLQAIHNIERAGEVVTVQDFAADTKFQAIIESSLFIQETPGSNQHGKSGRGGLLVLNLRTV